MAAALYHLGLRNRILTMYAPTAFACPRCRARPGHDCVTKTGGRSLAHHAPRRALATKLPNDDALLRLLLMTYEDHATNAPECSVWSGRAQIIRQLLATDDQ